jgi:hypothetical protein
MTAGLIMASPSKIVVVADSLYGWHDGLPIAEAQKLFIDGGTVVVVYLSKREFSPFMMRLFA